MQVLLTILVVAGVAAWALVVMRRLEKMRAEVKLVWGKLEGDQTNEAIKSVYNRHVATYNAALDTFPANMIAPLAGFKPARRY